MCELEELLHDPETLFHYTKVETAIEYILTQKHLRLSPFSDLHDPYEYKDIEYDIADYNTEKELIKAIEIGDTVSQKRKNGFKVACFCSNEKARIFGVDNNEILDSVPSLYGYANSRMWSQYANGHDGVCLVLLFSEIEMMGLFRPEIDGYTQRFSDIIVGPVDYRCELEKPVLMPTMVSELGEKQYEKKFMKDYYAKLFLQKSIDYRDENEFRICVYDPKDKYVYMDIHSSLVGVIIGDKVSYENKQKINWLCDSYGFVPDVREISWRQGKAEITNLLL